MDDKTPQRKASRAWQISAAVEIIVIIIATGLFVLLFFQISSGGINLVKHIEIPGVGKLTVPKGYLFNQARYQVTEQTLKDGLILWGPEGDEQIALSISSQRFTTLPLKSQYQITQGSVTRQERNFNAAVWSLGQDNTGQANYALSLETTIAPEKVFSLVYSGDPVLSTMVKRKVTINTLTQYVFKHAGFALATQQDSGKD